MCVQKPIRLLSQLQSQQHQSPADYKVVADVAVTKFKRNQTIMKDHDHDDVVSNEGETKVYCPTLIQQVPVIPPPFSQRILRGDSLKVAGIPPEIQFSDSFKTSRDFIVPRNSGKGPAKLQLVNERFCS
ncbi:hypothetical protein L1887_25290 [Cichorium endivia]|nr:hypothetical protein L1887_25290 [Cichorium endivia]